jgi:hypothetical protein
MTCMRLYWDARKRVFRRFSREGLKRHALHMDVLLGAGLLRPFDFRNSVT